MHINSKRKNNAPKKKEIPIYYTLKARNAVQRNKNKNFEVGLF